MRHVLVWVNGLATCRCGTWTAPQGSTRREGQVAFMTHVKNTVIAGQGGSHEP